MNAIHCYYLITLFLYIFVSCEARVFFVPDNTMQILAEGSTINVTCVYQGEAIPSDEVQIKRNGQDLKGFEFTRKGSTSAPWNKTKTGLKANASCEDEGNYICSIGKEDTSEQYISIIRDYSDLGPYQCKIVMFHGGDDTDKLILPIVSVHLQGPPKVTIEGNKDIYVCENHPVRILCKTEGFPKPDVVWHARLENAGEEPPPLPDGNELNIESFKSIHEGNYTCVANSFMFPQVEVKDSVRILLDGKGYCGPVTKGSGLSIIIAAAVGSAFFIVGGIVVLVVCLRRKGICKHSDEQPKIDDPVIAFYENTDCLANRAHEVEQDVYLEIIP